MGNAVAYTARPQPHLWKARACPHEGIASSAPIAKPLCTESCTAHWKQQRSRRAVAVHLKVRACSHDRGAKEFPPEARHAPHPTLTRVRIHVYLYIYIYVYIYIHDY